METDIALSMCSMIVQCVQYMSVPLMTSTRPFTNYFILDLDLHTLLIASIRQENSSRKIGFLNFFAHLKVYYIYIVAD